MVAVDLVIAASARKHGVNDSDIRHAREHPRRLFELDECRHDHRRQPRHDQLRARPVRGVPGPVVVHAMKARDKSLR